MSLLPIWAIGVAIVAVAGFCLIGLCRRPVGWRSVNWTVAFALIWPALLIGLVVAALLIICAMLRELGDEDPFWKLG